MMALVRAFDVTITPIFGCWFFEIGRVQIGKWEPAYVFATAWFAFWLSGPTRGRR